MTGKCLPVCACVVVCVCVCVCVCGRHCVGLSSSVHVRLWVCGYAVSLPFSAGLIPPVRGSPYDSCCPSQSAAACQVTSDVCVRNLE